MSIDQDNDSSLIRGLMVHKQEPLKKLNSNYSSFRSMGSQESINLERIHQFMQEKQAELNKLQGFLVTEFEEIERFKSVKQRISQIIGNQIIHIFRLAKQEFQTIILEYKRYFKQVNWGWADYTQTIITSKNQQIKSLSQKNSRLEYQNNKRIQNSLIRSRKIENQIKKDLDRCLLKKRNQDQNNKPLSIFQQHKKYSRIEEFPDRQNKDSRHKYQRFEIQANRHKIASKSYQRLRGITMNQEVRASKLQQSQSKRVMKYDKEEKTIINEHKRHVKQKIQLLKSRGSNVFNEKYEMKRSDIHKVDSRMYFFQPYVKPF